MGKMNFVGMDLRVASDVTFIPGADPKRNHAIVTVMNNSGKHPGTGEDMTDEITLNFWGKYSGVAANYLYPGKQINVTGRLQSYTKDTGQVNASGKKVLHRNVEVVVSNMQLLGDSMKKIGERIAKNVGILKAAGRLAPDVVLSAEELLKTDKTTMIEFNPAIATQTGRYGNARVWSKNDGFWDQKIGQITVPQIAATDPAAIAAEIQRMQEQLNSLTKANAPQTMEAGVEDPLA